MAKKRIHISEERFEQLPKEYFADPVSEFMGIGEWICRRILTGVQDETLFYEHRMMEVGKILKEKYVKKA